MWHYCSFLKQRERISSESGSTRDLNRLPKPATGVSLAVEEASSIKLEIPSPPFPTRIGANSNFKAGLDCLINGAHSRYRTREYSLTQIV